MLGGKALECFLFSAAHDPDEEFFRRYGARVGQMESLHQHEPTAADALARLRGLVPTAE